jgi:GT2 family glycosyltransferase
MAVSFPGLDSNTSFHALKILTKALAEEPNPRPVMKTALIITTYNWPEALRVTLESILSQSICPDHILIADDGSGPETARTIKEIFGLHDVPWCHVWHEDKGVRQSRIKNLAVKQTDCEYLIFIDQDVIPHPRFVEDHLLMAQKGFFLQGKRVLLLTDYTQRIIQINQFKRPSFFSKGIRNRKNTIRSKILAHLFLAEKKFETSLRGCNLSLFREDFIRVDGFDEIYDQSWGREDSDICYRLFHAGIKVKNLWFTALQYHLKHEVMADWDQNRLDAEMKKNLDERRTKAVKGFSLLSSEGKVVEASI